MLRSDAYSPRPTVTQRPRKYVSEQTCQLPLFTMTDDARSLKPTLSKFEIAWLAVNDRPPKPSRWKKVISAPEAGSDAAIPARRARSVNERVMSCLVVLFKSEHGQAPLLHQCRRRAIILAYAHIAPEANRGRGEGAGSILACPGTKARIACP